MNEGIALVSWGTRFELNKKPNYFLVFKVFKF
jgi:hypothetical protein